MLRIKVIGSGCPTCQKLGDMCKVVIDKNSLDASIEKVTDINKFAELGVFMTPGL
ncbi:MAG: thioredoxin family protein, partial [Calditrichia bacterium]|nr:thioredoxin family protein [Calditrichia bacterium]